MDFRQRYADEVLSIYLGSGLYLAVWRDAPGRIQMEALMRESGVLRREFPEGLVFANAIVGGTPKFDEPIKDLTVRATKRNAGWIVANVHIVLAKGFVGVATRAFISTVNLVSKSNYPTSVHTNCDDAAAWILPFLPRGVPKEESIALRELAESLESYCNQPYE